MSRLSEAQTGGVEALHAIGAPEPPGRPVEGLSRATFGARLHQALGTDGCLLHGD